MNPLATLPAAMRDNHLAAKTHRPSQGLQPSLQPSLHRGATASAALKAPLPLHPHLVPTSRIHSPGCMPPLTMRGRVSFNPPPRTPHLLLQLFNHNFNPTSLLHQPHLVCPLPIRQRLQPVLILSPSAAACVQCTLSMLRSCRPCSRRGIRQATWQDGKAHCPLLLALNLLPSFLFPFLFLFPCHWQS